uniref:Uncharacterized protein n=1 Tax=Glossina pallidipes TaxID=7398 RepID=A0A1B0A035_GLOPL
MKIHLFSRITLPCKLDEWENRIARKSPVTANIEIHGGSRSPTTKHSWVKREGPSSLTPLRMCSICFMPGRQEIKEIYTPIIMPLRFSLNQLAWIDSYNILTPLLIICFDGCSKTNRCPPLIILILVLVGNEFLKSVYAQFSPKTDNDLLPDGSEGMLRLLFTLIRGHQLRTYRCSYKR